MTPITTAMPSKVAKPEISINHRTLATIFCCSGGSGLSSSDSGLLIGVQKKCVQKTCRIQPGKQSTSPPSKPDDGSMSCPPPAPPPPPPPAAPGGERIPLNIVYEDKEIIVIENPAGLVVHPAAGHATG